MSSSAPPAKASQVNGIKNNAPNPTLYCTNVTDKLVKHDLRRALYTLFSTYGPVLDVVAVKTMKMRGQAHIVFRDTQTSAQAMRALQGYNFLGKELKISYAKGKSDAISRLDGSARMPESKSAAVETSDLQKSIFNAPSLANIPVTSATSLKAPPVAVEDGSKSPQGVKRPREDESEDEDVAMEEDDEGDAMEESDDD